ncbi:hypothetical protein [Zobellia barbeyronii]|uniref:Uncharacterized protein n=1 Tax=Zobellia barbeyronii TaxID=2748009 RepID=A0ABS5WGC8_9FLAO|nr:hypothetical protein [Zobellia barbeyronii]MBT2161890.1 hypothetical protein [Zobellia barbeyronii]
MKRLIVMSLSLIALYPSEVVAQVDGNYLLGLTNATTLEMNTGINPVAGSLLYNTDEEKMYLNTASGFKKIPSIDTNSVDFWGATGNTGSNATTHFLGTTDLQDFVMKTDNSERIRISSTGNVGINNPTPNAQIDIESAGVPLRIQPSTTTPTGTESGQIFMGNDGILYAYDGSRTKWLSVDRTMVGWGVNNPATTLAYMRQFNGAESDKNGWRMLRDGTITGITVQTENANTWTLEIRKNDGLIPIAVLAIAATEGGQDDTINIDFNQGDFLQAYCNGTAVEYPETLIEIAWRK